jgi:hypothetical protein
MRELDELAIEELKNTLLEMREEEKEELKVKVSDYTRTTL